jgi:putative endonuclease
MDEKLIDLICIKFRVHGFPPEPVPAKAGAGMTNVVMMKSFYVYILSSRRHGTLYIGVTSNLIKRVFEHRENLANGFSSKYKVHHLVYYEEHTNIASAIVREKQIKKWHRQWKINLIERTNPEWLDFYPTL